MKGSTYSSSGEFSESQGLNDFLNAHSTRDEANVLNKNQPQPSYIQSMNPRHNDLMNYYPPSSFGNQYGGAMLAPGQGYYNYEDEEFEEYGGEEGYMEYEEERDPYDFEIDFGPAKKKNQAKVLDKSYEERKKALQKKRDQKKKEKEEEEKRKEEEEKRLKIQVAIQKEQSKSKKSLLSEEKAKPQLSEKVNFDLSEAMNESQSPKSRSRSKSQEVSESVEDGDYEDPKPVIYDPNEMMKYLGKSGLGESQPNTSSAFPNNSSAFPNNSSAIPVENTKNESEINQNLTNTFNNTSKFTTTNQNVSEKYTTNNNISENYTGKLPRNEEVVDESDSEDKREEKLPKLAVSTPTGGFEGLVKASGGSESQDKFIDVNQKAAERSPELNPNPIESQSKGLQPGNLVLEPSSSKQDSFNTFAGEKRPNDFQEGSLRSSGLQTKTGFHPQAPSKIVETRLTEMKLGQKSEELEFANQKIEAYQTEIEELVRQLETSERKVLHLERELKEVRLQSESKIRVLQEKSVFIDKMTENRLTLQLTEQFALEKEALQMEIENLGAEVSAYKAQNEAFFNARRELKILEAKYRSIEGENLDLKKELIEYKELIKDPIVQRRALRTRNKDRDEDDDSDFLREFEFQELLIKGYQRENEKNCLIIKDLREELSNLERVLQRKEGVITDMRVRGAREMKGGLVVEDPKIDVIKGVISPESIVDLGELRELRSRMGSYSEEIKGLKEGIEKERSRNSALEERVEKERSSRTMEVQRLEEEMRTMREERERLEKESEKVIEGLRRELQERKKELLEIERERKSATNEEESEERPTKIEKKPALKPNPKVVLPRYNLPTTKSSKTAAVASNNLEKGPKTVVDKKPLKTEEMPAINYLERNLSRFFTDSGWERIFQILNMLKTGDSRFLAEEIDDLPREFEGFRIKLSGLIDLADETERYKLKSLFSAAIIELLKKEKPLFPRCRSPRVLEEDPRSFKPMIKTENRETDKRVESLEKENRSLKEIIMNTPKNPTRVDFELLERKLELVERAYRQKDLEIQAILQSMRNPGQYNEAQGLRIEVMSLRGQLKEGKAEMERKNAEIEEMKEELGDLLRELEGLKS